MKAFTIPSIFTAVDGYSGTVRNMGRSIEHFATKSEVAIARSERAFRKFTPGLSDVTKQFLNLASVATVIAGITFSFNALKDYETAVQSFRTIVSDLNDADFSKYEDKIQQVANEAKKSTIDTAKAFEMIAGLNEKFAETPESISAVTSAAITLSKASRDELGKSAENLTGILNQFNLGAQESNRVINVLAAGQAVGASSITQTADAFTVFGAVANSANLSLEESVALVEVLAAKQIQGAEAGTALRGSILALQKANLGYQSGVFNTKDALVELNQMLSKLTTAKERDALMTDVFGVINRTTGTILTNSVKAYEDFTVAVTGTSEAQKAAEINSNSLSIKLEELKNRWINIITSSDEAGSALDSAKTVIGFLTDHLDILVSVGTAVLLFFAAWKTLLIIGNIALAAYNIGLGVMGALTGVASIAIGKSSIALGAYNIVTFLAAKATGAFAVALGLAGLPIWLIALAIVALIALVTAIILKWNEWGAALSLFLGPLGMIIGLIQSFRRNWDMIKEAFRSGGIIGGIKAIGAAIIDVILMPIQQIVSLIADLTGAEWAQNAVKNIEAFRKDLGVNVETDEGGKPLPNVAAVNNDSARQEAIRESITTQRQNVAIDIRDQTGKASMVSDNNFIPVKLTSTVGAGW